jgi:hypothetical protein
MPMVVTNLGEAGAAIPWEDVFIKDLGPYLQHFIFFKWAQ